MLTLVLSLIPLIFPATPPSPIQISFVGDIMLGSRVKQQITTQGCESVFGGTQTLFANDDAVIVNLETAVTTGGNKYNKKYTFRADPTHLKCLTARHPRVIANLANNHIGDYGAAGVQDTIQHLQNNNIAYFGAGKDKTAAYALKVLQINTTKIGLIGQTCIQPKSFGAKQTTGQNNYGNAQFDKDVLLQNIKKAKEQKIDILVFNGHCGKEYTNGPHSSQREMYHFAINNGVNLVIGHHPHRIQGIEQYRDAFIFYSLGNFISDIFRGDNTQQGLVATLTIFNKKIQKIDLTPVHIFGYGKTKLSTMQESKKIFQRLSTLSKSLIQNDKIITSLQNKTLISP